MVSKTTEDKSDAGISGVEAAELAAHKSVQHVLNSDAAEGYSSNVAVGDNKTAIMSFSQSSVSKELLKEHWFRAHWRPAMAWMYMVTCIFDFILFPMLWSLLQAKAGGAVNIAWTPITLIGGGLFHVAMGAVIGITAYGRTQEKLNQN